MLTPTAPAEGDISLADGSRGPAWRRGRRDDWVVRRMARRCGCRQEGTGRARSLERALPNWFYQQQQPVAPGPSEYRPVSLTLFTKTADNGRGRSIAMQSWSAAVGSPARCVTETEQSAPLPSFQDSWSLAHSVIETNTSFGGITSSVDCGGYCGLDLGFHLTSMAACATTPSLRGDMVRLELYWRPPSMPQESPTLASWRLYFPHHPARVYLLPASAYHHPYVGASHTTLVRPRSSAVMGRSSFLAWGSPRKLTTNRYSCCHL